MMSKKCKKGTRIALAIAAAVLLTGLGVYATRSKAMTLDDAKVLAQKELPQSAEYVDGTESENKFRTLFYDGEHNGRYEVEVSKKTGKVKKIGLKCVAAALLAQTGRLAGKTLKKSSGKNLKAYEAFISNQTQTTGTSNMKPNLRETAFTGRRR